MKFKKFIIKNLDFIEKIFILFICILYLILSVFYLNHSQILMWDEPVYLSNAISHISESHFTEDFRFPLLEYIIAFFWSIFGISQLIAQILIISISILTILFFYLISRLILKITYLRILLVSVFAFSSLLLYWGYRIYSDVGSLMFLLMTIYIFLLYLKKKEKVNLNDKFNFSKIKSYFNLFIIQKIEFNFLLLIFITGILNSLAFLMRYPAAIFSILIIAYLIYKKNIKDLFYYALGNLFILFPWMLNNYLKYGNIFWDLITQMEVINAYTNWEPLNLFFNNLFLSSGFIGIFFILFLFLYIKHKKYRFDKYINFIFLLLVLSLLYYSLGVKLKLLRYQLMIIPFLYILIFKGFEYLIENNFFIKLKKNKKINKNNSNNNFNNFEKIQNSQKKFCRYFQKENFSKMINIKIIFFILLSLLVLIQINYNISYTSKIILEEYDFEKNSSHYQSIIFVENNIESGELIISNAWPWYGFYGNHRVSSIWDLNISNILIDMENVYAYLALNSLHHIPENISFNGELIKNFTDENGYYVELYKVYR